MEFEELFKQERVTRKFSNKRVSEKILAGIIKEAQLSPSLLNSQPWRAYAATDQALAGLRKEFEEKTNAGETPHEDFAAMLSLDWDTFPSQNMAAMGASQAYFFRDKLDLFTEANNTMFNAPAVVFLTVPRKSPAWSVFDLGIFAQSIMLLALNRGLSIMPAHSMVSYPELVRKYVHIPESELVGMAIGIGYKDKGAEVNDPKFFPDRVPFEKIYQLSNK
ncbi:nitroreductase [Lactobacillus sp. ESL0791]|uniref:nitroreductase n=1 Tax=Lactobacillus sp. ESL0791 TaxID=2983234 RepID=UPI0023F8B2B3|nr:nitroreductase [Lactobacillus sp. ESL0791]MDF7639217.1 nitroreductase [Lactobacillus sp. ESL0791]